MNERIKELAEQAGIHPSNFEPDADIKIPLEKFAELIVRECLKCSEPLIKHYINTHTEQDQALLLASVADYSCEIKKHLEVEE